MGEREAGGYEWGVQVICARALNFMQAHGEEPEYRQFKNIIGVAIPEGKLAEAMDDYILLHPGLTEYGITGAMHQYGTAHAIAIFRKGREKYLEEMRNHRQEPDDFFEFEEDDAFPPEAPRLTEVKV